jgi:hypothetical protein
MVKLMSKLVTGGIVFFLILPVTPKENRKQSEKDWNMIFISCLLFQGTRQLQGWLVKIKHQLHIIKIQQTTLPPAGKYA